ncbi:AraC family transcriptional regulator [Arachidicoccus terrestris]|uniref:AraC family transcriptional regulator n=1 Tax=Arachidicoccus terrestris TaxID=2875539 RepID=UPI001CC5F952|nr:AraC family transcriptional regulator [Arachidicoccus terrestris]UAY55681.1 helix-turn-helix domain-containing protein [Arachidicoccus terrestris]
MAFFDFHTSKRDIFDWANAPYAPGGKPFLLGCQVISLNSGWGDMHFHFYPRPKYTIYVNMYESRQHRKTVAEFHGESLEFTFMMGGSMVNQVGGFKEEEVRTMQYNISYYPGFESRSIFEKDHFYLTLDIHFTKEYIEELSGEFPVQLAPLIESMEKRKPCRLNQLPFFADMFVKEAGNRIFHFLKNGSFFPMEMDQEVATLMRHVIAPKLQVGRELLDTSRRQVLNEVYGQLTRQLMDMPKLAKLQRQAGMSATMLREMFKATFGQNMRAAWVSHRMDEALSMIAYEREKKIREIGLELGFLNVSNFSKAFISTYGTSPRSVRKSGNWWNLKYI